jgi:hypothetical protein
MRSRRGSVLHITLALCVTLGALYWTSLPTAGVATSAARKAASRMGPATPAEVELALARAGLTLRTVAAAGLNAQQVGAAIADASAAVRANIEDLRTADIAAGQARTSVNRLESLIRSGVATEQDLTTYAAEQAALETAVAQSASVIAAILADAAESMSPEQLGLIQTMAANGHWDVPLQYRVVNRAQSEWLSLRDALANVKIATRMGEDPDAAAEQVLTAADENTTVGSAVAGLASAQELAAAWAQAVAP